jgi:peptidoglycan/LPS O-acetylase OafA/YrhL
MKDTLTIMSHDSPLAYRADIDGLRGVAVLLVIAFHAFPAWFKGGFIGVDIFFVISGFLISSIIFKSNARGDFSFFEFYARRARRLFPALCVVLTASCVLGWIYLFPDEYQQLGKHIAAGAAFVQNFLLWHEVGYFDTSAELKPLLHLWSLAVEEQFYLVYPVAVWVLWRRRMNVLTAVVLVACISFSLNIARVARHPAEVFFLLHSRFWELLEGGILAYILLFKLKIPGPTPRQRNALSIMGVLLIATAVSILNKNRAFPGWWAQLPVTGTLLLVLAGPSAWINRVFLAAPAMSFLGRISYPLYLWHWTILSFARIDNPDVTALARAGLVVLSFPLAWITYQFVEKPIRFGRHSLRGVSIGMASALFTTGVVGFLIFHVKGVPSRLPESGETLAALEALATYRYDLYSETRVGDCWLSGTQAPDGFAQACYGNLCNKEGDRTVVLWGDSHAACLFPGVRAVCNDARSVAQFTRDTCPPMLGYAKGTIWGNCEDSNQFVASLLKKHPQATVILFAAWTLYNKDWTAGSPAGKALLATIRELHDAGVTRIIVMGPSPWWKKELPKLAIKLARSHFQEGFTVPSRMNFGLDPWPAIVDKQLRTLLAGSPATYFSVFDTLCDNVEGCLVRTTDKQTSFTAFDYGHLTTNGARLVAGQLPLPPPFGSEHRHFGANP